MYTSSIDFIMLWRELSFSYRIFVLILIAVTIHCLVSAIFIVKCLRRLRALANLTGSTRSTLSLLNTRCVRLRQILGATFYLFGFLLFVGLQSAPLNLLGLSHAGFVDMTLRNLEFHFIFAANVFPFFLVLHIIQWVVTSRAQALTQNLNL